MERGLVSAKKAEAVEIELGLTEDEILASIDAKWDEVDALSHGELLKPDDLTEIVWADRKGVRRRTARNQMRAFVKEHTDCYTCQVWDNGAKEKVWVVRKETAATNSDNNS